MSRPTTMMMIQRAILFRLWRVWNGMRYACGKSVMVQTTCPHCQRDVETEARW